MLKYLNAEFHRLVRRVPRVILLLLINLCYIAVYIYLAKNSPEDMNSVSYVQMAGTFTGFFAVLYGVIELMYVFGDDFKACALVTAIGCGLSRRKAVIAKYLEAVIITGLDILVSMGIIHAIHLFAGYGLVEQQLIQLNLGALSQWMKAAAFMAITMPVLMKTMKLPGALLLYLILAAGIGNLIITLLTGIRQLEGLGLSRFTLTGLLDTFAARLQLGIFSPERLAGILLYVVAAMKLTGILFKKSELKL